MARKNIGSVFDRNNRNAMNDNFKELYEGIETSSSWKEKSDAILDEANRVNETNIDVQRQLDSLILESGTSDAEVIQARGSHNVLNARLNSMEQGSTEILSKINLPKKEANLLSTFFLKLNKKEPVTITCMGDSMTYGSDFSGINTRPADTETTDDGSSHSAERALTSYPESLQKYLNDVYGDNVSVINKGFSGDGTKKGYQHWNASSSDLCIISYGINDATNTSTGYVGDVDEYLKWYRLIIERELNNGTPVILMTPTKQRVPAGSVNSNRIDVDIYSEAVRLLAKEYNLDIIDGQELLLNYSADIYSDLTHLNSVGYDILGARIASTIIGKGINKPFEASHGTFQGVLPYLHSLVYKSGSYSYSNYYPTASDQEVDKGAGAVLRNGDKLYFSFYAKSDGLFVIPSMFSSSSDIELKMSLDFGVKNADYNSDYHFGKSPVSPVAFYPDSYITIEKGKFNSGDIHSSAFLKSFEEPMLYIPKKGFHSITVEVISGTGTLTLHGLEYFDSLSLKTDKSPSTHQLSLLNGTTNFYTLDPVSVSKTYDGVVTLGGTLNNIPEDRPAVVAILPQEFRPSGNKAFPIALSSSTVGGYGTVMIDYKTGEIRVTHTSANVNYASLNGITYKV